MVCVNGKVVDSLNVHSLLRGLPYLEGGKVVSKKVKDLFVVNFHVRAFYRELIGRGFDVFKKVFEKSWQDSSGLGINIFLNVGKDTKNGVCFTRAGLSVGKN